MKNFILFSILLHHKNNLSCLKNQAKSEKRQDNLIKEFRNKSMNYISANRVVDILEA
jgi:hypothetical protein